MIFFSCVSFLPSNIALFPRILDAPHLRLSPLVFLCLCLAAWESRYPTTTRSPKSSKTHRKRNRDERVRLWVTEPTASLSNRVHLTAHSPLFSMPTRSPPWQESQENAKEKRKPALTKRVPLAEKQISEQNARLFIRQVTRRADEKCQAFPFPILHEREKIVDGDADAPRWTPEVISEQNSNVPIDQRTTVTPTVTTRLVTLQRKR